MPNHKRFSSSEDESTDVGKEEKKKNKERERSRSPQRSSKEDRADKYNDRSQRDHRDRRDDRTDYRRNDDRRRDDNRWNGRGGGGGRNNNWRESRGGNRSDQYQGGRGNGRDSNHEGNRTWNDSKQSRKRDNDNADPYEKRLTEEEKQKQKKLLWSKPVTEGQASSSSIETQGPSMDAPKNAGLWSSAIAASGVGGQQANKFLKLMGIKNAPAAETTDEKRIREESERQKKMREDLDKQYAIARESTHMGKGMGFGFHG